MASAAEAEVGALYMNAQEAVPFRTCLIEMGHPQPATPLKTDNMTAKGIIAGTIKQKRSKAMDMRFYWLKDRYDQGQFGIHWEPGKHNLADYPTKVHPGRHHGQVRPIYLNCEEKSPTTMQGCIEILTAPDRARAEKLKLKLKQSATASYRNWEPVRTSVTASYRNRESAFASHKIRGSTGPIIATSNIISTWYNRTKSTIPRSTHYLFRTSL